MSKAIVCDICGKVIDKEGQYEYYHFFMKDPQGEHWFWPKRLDVCYDCLEELRIKAHNRSVEKAISAYKAMGNMEEAVDKFIDDVLPEEKPKKTRKKKISSETN